MSSQPTPSAALSRGPLRSSGAATVGSAAIDPTPTPPEECAVRTFGTRDKAVPPGGIHPTTALLAVQPESRAAPFPAGATGRHSTVVTVT
ncbi:hypothetical protein ACFY00_37170 [Kitasatospora sp. NPDC001540]|uniref:hypothetical protein n=1 Tax=Kitasatospora sp. NPDC001540 TaxID=3364014 RepID=UPI0036BE50CA